MPILRSLQDDSRTPLEFKCAEQADFADGADGFGAAGGANAAGAENATRGDSSAAGISLTVPIPLRRTPQGYELCPRAGLYLNGNLVQAPAVVRPGDRISLEDRLYVFEADEIWESRTQLAEVGEASSSETYTAFIAINDRSRIVLGRELNHQVFRLAHPLVSRRHLQLTRSGSQALLKDLGSSNGTWVNGRSVTQASLRPCDTVTVGPFVFIWTGTGLKPTTSVEIQPSVAQLVAQPLSCQALTRTLSATGQTLLHQISLSIKPGEFVCLVGPSGAGKSTLLRALANRETSNRHLKHDGKVLLGDLDLQANFEFIKQQLAFVPQHEILFNDLDIRTSLRFTAQLRLPRDIEAGELAQRIEQTLKTVGLEHCAETRIRNLSGGQRRRASLANELIACPSLLYLDEVTSGLDERTDSEMMRLFRNLSQSGRTVLCVTHNLANVERDCDRVIALTRFGRLAFSGSPAAAKDYFAVERLSQIYDQLAVTSPAKADHLAARFSASLTESSANESFEGFSQGATQLRTAQSSAGHLLKPHALPWSDRLRQLKTLLHRYFLTTASDTQANVLRAAQCGVVALLVCSVFGSVADDLQGQLFCAFIVVLSSFWFGCNNSAKELVRERGIFDQERRVVVEPVCYAFSKWSLLSCLASLQAWLLTWLVWRFCELPGSYLAWASVAGLLAVSGVSVGLAISAKAQSEEAAIALVPIVLIPQIILSGALANLESINVWLAKLAVSAYWGIEAARDLMVTNSGQNWGTAIGMLAIQAACGLALVVSFLKDRSHF